MKNRVKFDLAFLDMVFNLVLAFAFLFLMSFLLIRPEVPPEKKAVEMKAEFVITMSWPDGSLDDQDLWIRMPDGRNLGYSFKDIGVATLDRDDRGGWGNTYVDPVDQLTKIQRTRREIITIRAIIPGRYVVNVHTFSARNKWDNFETEAPLPYEVEINMIKLNPRVEEVVKRKIRFEKLNDQHTAFAFIIDPEGRVVEVDTETEEPFIPTTKAEQ